LVHHILSTTSCPPHLVHHILSATDRPPPTNGQRSIHHHLPGSHRFATGSEARQQPCPEFQLRPDGARVPRINTLRTCTDTQPSTLAAPYTYIPMNDARRDAIRIPDRLKLSSATDRRNRRRARGEASGEKRGQKRYPGGGHMVSFRSHLVNLNHLMFSRSLARSLPPPNRWTRQGTGTPNKQYATPTGPAPSPPLSNTAVRLPVLGLLMKFWPWPLSHIMY
ncbi:hypothetical protein CSHISOI_07457, partial [Colletotrichum shisoi]